MRKSIIRIFTCMMMGLGFFMMVGHAQAYLLLNSTDQYMHFEQTAGGGFKVILGPNESYGCTSSNPVCHEVKKGSIVKFKVFYLELIKGQLITHVICQDFPMRSSWSLLRVTGENGNYSCSSKIE